MQQKCTTTLRQLAYGRAAYVFDDYLHVADTTGRKCLKKFCRGIVETFKDTYQRKPNVVDCQALLNLHEMTHRFPGMLGAYILCIERGIIFRPCGEVSSIVGTQACTQ